MAGAPQVPFGDQTAIRGQPSRGVSAVHVPPSGIPELPATTRSRVPDAESVADERRTSAVAHTRASTPDPSGGASRAASSASSGSSGGCYRPSRAGSVPDSGRLFPLLEPRHPVIARRPLDAELLDECRSRDTVLVGDGGDQSERRASLDSVEVIDRTVRLVRHQPASEKMSNYF